VTALAYRAAVAGFRREHERLRSHTTELEVAARELPELSHDERLLLIGRIVDLLENDIRPHAWAAEEVLYPAFETQLQPGALGRMVSDHLRVTELEQRLITTDVDATTALQEALYDLQGLLETHFKKEEDIFLPLLAGQPDDELDRIFRAMNQAAGPESPRETEVTRCP